MAQKEQHCAFCKAILFDDDDVVYCPECGAPHHRECYQSLGHCAREEYHRREDLPAEEETSPAEPDRDNIVCPSCGLTCRRGTPFCPRCNARLSEDPSAAPADEYDPYNGVSPEESIDGVSVTEMASYVRVNTRRYLPCFQKLSATGHKCHWNWGGFVFGHTWLFFRKCYLHGLGALLFTVVAYLMMCPLLANGYRAYYAIFGSLTAEELQQATGSPVYMDRLASEFFQTTELWMVLLFYLGILSLIAIHVVIGLLGDRVYLNHSVEKITAIRANDEIDNKLQAMLLTGGVNLFIGLLAFYGASAIMRILLILFVS